MEKIGLLAGARIACSKLLITTLGRSSRGISLCLEHGLTAGYTLEYVYQNRAHGRLLVGRWIDRIYLDDPGWKAVRQRKDHLRDALVRAIDEDRAQGRGSRVLDIAAGLAQYLFEALETTGSARVSAICEDLEQEWVDRGNEKAAARRLTNVRFRRGDALEPRALAAGEARPTIAVSAGFYDWIVEDELVVQSLSLCHQALAEGGRIIFTNQIANPKLELLCAVFPDHRRQALRMKMRPTEQINELAAAAGFEILRTATDPWGRHSVTEGRKP